jgi:hypothetical protein
MGTGRWHEEFEVSSFKFQARELFLNETQIFACQDWGVTLYCARLLAGNLSFIPPG